MEADGWVKGLSCGCGLLFFGGRGLGCCRDKRAARSCWLRVGVGGGSFLIGGDFRESILLCDGNGQSSGHGDVRGIILTRAAPAWESRRGICEDCVGLVMGGSLCIGGWGEVVLCITGGSGFNDSMRLIWAMVSTALGRLGALVNGAAGF